MQGRAPRRLLQLALRVSYAQHWARVLRETNAKKAPAEETRPGLALPKG